MNFNASARHAFAREVMLLGLNENNLTVDGCMDGKIATHEGARTGNLCSASLTLCRFLLVPPALTCDILLFP